MGKNLIGSLQNDRLPCSEMTNHSYYQRIFLYFFLYTHPFLSVYETTTVT